MIFQINIPINKLLANAYTAGQRPQEIKHDVKITFLSIFLQGFHPTLKVNVVAANLELKRYCLTNGWDFIEYGNIAFKHLDAGGMTLNHEGNRLLASNILAHTRCG